MHCKHFLCANRHDMASRLHVAVNGQWFASFPCSEICREIGKKRGDTLQMTPQQECINRNQKPIIKAD